MTVLLHGVNGRGNRTASHFQMSPDLWTSEQHSLIPYDDGHLRRVCRLDDLGVVLP